jgi:PAS domain S-box-containing protein
MDELVENDESNLERLRELGNKLTVAESALKRQNNTLEAIADVAISALITLDDEGRVLTWNPKAVEVFGYTEEEAVGKYLHDLIIPDRLKIQHSEGLRRFKEDSVMGPVLDGKIHVMPARDKWGNEFLVELAVKSLDLPNEPTTFVGFVRSIADRERLRISQENYLQVLTGTMELLDENELSVKLCIDILSTVLERLLNNREHIRLALQGVDTHVDNTGR